MSCHKRFILLAGWTLIAGLILAACGPAATATPMPLATTITPTTTATSLAATRVPPIDAPPPAVSGVTRELTITILYDNTAYDARLQADWGFAALIEYRGHTLLFDTGANGQTLVSNMDKLGIDLKKIEAIVLSHAHDDHIKGLQALLDNGRTPKVYVPSSFSSSLKGSVRARTSLVEVSAPMEILPGLHSTGELGTSIIEQALVIETGQGMVVITGCAHPGIVSIVSQAKKMVKGDVALLVGGLHLLDFSSSQVKQIIADLRALGVRQVLPTHCTGEAAIAAFAETFGADYIQGGAGRVIKVVQTPIPTPTAVSKPSAAVETVSLMTEDEVKLSATLFGEGKLAVILAHQGTEGADPTSWQPFARLLADKGYAALTLDFRGRGQSQGYLQASQLIKDLNAAIQFLHGRGYQRIVCMGASMGGTACLRAALDHDLAGLVVIASPMSSGPPTSTEPDELSRLKLPKLYICTDNDRYSLVIPQMKQMFELSTEPKQEKFFPGTVHGTELFDTEHGDEFRSLLLSFGMAALMAYADN